MEALQYLRMMEEQAEYDNDELEKVNGLLTEKEKEIQDLEAKLEFYRSNMVDEEPMVYNMSIYPMKALKIVLPARITPLRCHGKLEFALLLKLLLLL